MRKQKECLVIREYLAWVIFGLASYFLLILFLIADIVADITGNQDISFDFSDVGTGSLSATIILLIIAPFILYSVIKGKGTYVITPEHISAKYQGSYIKGHVDLTEPVYYAFYTEAGFRQKRILISNERIELNQRSVLCDIDSSTQISLPYTKRVKNKLPQNGWIKITLPEGDYKNTNDYY